MHFSFPHLIPSLPRLTSPRAHRKIHFFFSIYHLQTNLQNGIKERHFLLCLVISVSKDRDKRSGRTISESLCHKGDGSVTLQTFILKFYTKHIDIAKHSVYLKSFVHSTLNPIIRCYPAKEGFVCAEVEINQLEAKSAENRAKNVGRREVGVNQKI